VSLLLDSDVIITPASDHATEPVSGPRTVQ